MVEKRFTEADARGLCQRLRGLPRPLTAGIVEAARSHRLHRVLANQTTSDERAQPAVAVLWRDLQASAAIEAADEPVLRGTVASLEDGGVNAVLIKGVAVGYTVYDAPHLRPRTDTDILVPRSSMDAADRVLRASGWDRPPEPHAQAVGFQWHYVRPGAADRTQHLDLHRQIASPRAFAGALPFDRLWERSVPLPALGPGARIPSPVDALLIACMHRVAHHEDEVQLLWLWDIHLLVTRMTAGDRERFARLATEILMAAVCARGLELARDWFDTDTGDLIATLSHSAAGRNEPSARFIGGLRRAAVLQSDLAPAGWRDRAAILREHLFPPAAYLRSRYPRWPRALLPVAYVHRIVRGAPKWFRR